MTVHILARQVTVTESDTTPCRIKTTDPDDGVTWYCTLHPGHDGAHVAHYEDDDPENPEVLIAGLIWIGED